MAERVSQLTVDSSRFTENEVSPHHNKPILGYDPRFDQETYQVLSLQKDSLAPKEFTRRKKQLDTRTEHNLETALGERFNLQISQIEYRIEDNRLTSAEHDEPFLDVIKRGQRYRQEHGSDDVEREKAEIEGFEKVQSVLTNPEHQDAKVVIIYPRGKTDSMYQHNFFDVWEKRGDLVIMSRYASSANYEEFRQAAEFLDPFNSLDQNPQDADFIRNPLITYRSQDEILELLKLDSNAMNTQEYENLVETIETLKLSYINALANGDWELAQKIYTATLNLADDVILNPAYNQYLRERILMEAPAALMATYGSHQVRPVLAGCGLQTNFAGQNSGELLSALFPYSVSNFGPLALIENADTGDFPCPRCGHMIIYGAGIKECPSCHLAATCG